MLVHIHGVELEVLGDAFLKLQVDVLVVKFLAHLEEGARVSIGAHQCAVVHLYRVLVESAYMAHVELYLGAILAAEGSLALEGVGCFALEGPFAIGILRGIGVEGRQCIGVLIGKGGHVIDIGCHEIGRASCRERV